jgi:hypothetical protein
MVLEQPQAVPYRLRAVDPPDRVSIVNQLKATQAWRQHARAGAVAGVDQRVRGQQITEHGVCAAAAQRIAEHEHVAAAQPGQ